MSDEVLREDFGKVSRLTLNRPDRLNAINDALRGALEGHLRDIARDDGISVVIIRGAGRAFCSGYDLKALPGNSTESSAYYQGGAAVTADRERLRETAERLMWLWNFPKPTIAQVHGYCLGGGGEMAAMCDITICADTAKFGHPAGRAVGIPVTLALWPLKMGLQKAKEYMFTGDFIPGPEARELGLANRCVPQDRLDEEVMDYAQRVAMVPLPALSIHKHVANRWFEVLGVRTMMAEGVEFDVLFHQTSAATDFAKLVQVEGLQKALDLRDGPFRRPKLEPQPQEDVSNA
ncbi:enoyl-CoA hydratase [Rhizobium aquaticum]|uniref:Enoyl-CoA hydratase n=1 Tax=Rhizobium aquaticum TaxID=1549636 RepID=A0ABV2J8M1_9HYPH